MPEIMQDLEPVYQEVYDRILQESPVPKYQHPQVYELNLHPSFVVNNTVKSTYAKIYLMLSDRLLLGYNLNATVPIINYRGGITASNTDNLDSVYSMLKQYEHFIKNKQYSMIKRMNEAFQSALFMHRERLMLYEERGRKLPDWLEKIKNEINANPRYAVTNDMILTALNRLSIKISAKYYATIEAGHYVNPSEYVAPDGIFVYDDERRYQYELAEQQRLLRQREAAALEMAREAGGLTPAQVLALSQVATATDPATLAVMQNMAYNMMTGQPLPTAAQVVQQVTHPTQPAVTTNERFAADAAMSVTVTQANLPASVQTQLGTVDSARHVYQIITLPQSPDLARMQTLYEYGRDLSREIFEQLFGEVQRTQERARWQSIAPRVEMRPEDNRHLSALQLNTRWQGAPGQKPPLVLLRVTPQKKPMPVVKKSLFSRIWGFIAPVVSAIPGVGPVLSLAGSVVNAQLTQQNIQQQVNNFLSSRIPVNAFEPQYNPQPFQIMLPLDLAQAVVAEPWAVKMVYEYFMDKQAQEYMRAAQAGMAQLQRTATATTTRPAATSRPAARPAPQPVARVTVTNPFAIRR